jgi:predicted nuclease of predicted toxin-antitoxin system
MAASLQQAGYVAFDVRDVGLGGQSDSDVFDYAQKHHHSLVTADLGFSNILQYPLGSHHGIIVMRVPNEVTISQSNALLVESLRSLVDESLDGLLVIMELGRTRIRRPPVQ